LLEKEMLLFWKGKYTFTFLAAAMCHPRRHLQKQHFSVLITLVTSRYKSTAAGKRQYILLLNSHFSTLHTNF